MFPACAGEGDGASSRVMVFSSLTFLFVFLPVLLAAYYAVPARHRNAVALAGSAFFYAWGAPRFVIVLVVSGLADFWLSRELPLKAFNLRDRDGYAAAVKKVAEKMVSVPKDTVIAQSDSGPLTAHALGARDAVNQKALNKLSADNGKLSWAFKR